MALGDQTNPILVKQNDTRPSIRAYAWQGTATTPVDITGSSVVFNMRLSTAPNTIVASRRPATILPGATGGMEYTLTTAQTGTVGLYQAEFEVTFADGGILTFPSGSSYIYIQVGDDIA
jgi:hypothetical protein